MKSKVNKSICFVPLDSFIRLEQKEYFDRKFVKQPNQFELFASQIFIDANTPHILLITPLNTPNITNSCPTN